MKRVSLYLIFQLALLLSFSQEKKTFTNPLLPSGPDPYSFYKDGFYYYTHTTGNRLVLYKAKTIADLKSAEQKTIFVPDSGKEYSKDLWAPEVIFLRGKWYAYFAADGGRNISHRMYVLENSSPDPMKGEWVMKGKLATEKWAIDADVFEYKGQLYAIWSGWKGDTNHQQDIYIAAMKDPWTIDGKRVLLSEPEFEWEKHGDLKSKDPDDPTHLNVNEGPQFLEHGKDLFIVYSGSACWTDFYALGLLRLTGTDPLNPKHWKKYEEPVFKQSPENGVYATGHNSFFKSPDGKEDWILYHANSNPGDGCGNKRSPRAQRFTWKADGTPDFGMPVKEGTPIPLPSGSK